MARRNQYEEELEGVIASVTDAKRKATMREQNLQRQISRLTVRKEQMEEEEKLMREIRDGKACADPAPAAPAAAAAPAPAAPSPAKPTPATPSPAPASPAPAKPAPAATLGTTPDDV